MARICIVGAGYVGLNTGVAFASKDHQVVLVDADEAKVQAVRAGRVPFHEPGLPEALRDALARGRLSATTVVGDAVRGSELTFLCVGTPAAPDGSADLRYLRAACREVGQALKAARGFHVVVTKSTVPPGTTLSVTLAELRAATGREPGTSYDVASNPEFLREGSALADALHPDRIVVGARSEKVAQIIWSVYEGHECPKLTVDPTTAEMIKYGSNAFLAAKVGLANDVANVCERIGIDWKDVAAGIGADARIGPQFLHAGAGFGGSCFPKDLAALAHLSRAVGSPSSILEAVLAANDRQPLRAVDLLREELGDLDGRTVALLGLAFKADTDDVRETRALAMLRALVAGGARVRCHDPRAGANFLALAGPCDLSASAEDALRGADGCIVQTAWAEYRAVPAGRFVELMRAPVVIDARRTFDADAMLAAGVRYRAIGLGRAATR